VDPIKATVNVQDYMFAIAQQAQTSLRSIIGQSEMDQLLAERDSVNRELRRIIDEPTEGPWGIRVERVEVKDVSLPEGMKRSMSRQAEAERERRARIITADGEYQASKRLAAAANVMARDPAALQLRLLQTMVEVAGERNSTLIMPVPVELLRFFEKMAPGPPQPVARPDEPEDLGDAEVAEAEAEISMSNVPELEEASAPPVPEVAPVTDVDPVPEISPIVDVPPIPAIPSPAETTQELPAALNLEAAGLPSEAVADPDGAGGADVAGPGTPAAGPNGAGRNGMGARAAIPRKPRVTGDRKPRASTPRKPRPASPSEPESPQAPA
jgi:hypothetical protein